MNRIKEILYDQSKKDEAIMAELKKLGVEINYDKMWRIKTNRQQPTLFESNAFCMVLGVQNILK